MTTEGVGPPTPQDEVPLRLHDEVPLLLKAVIAESDTMLALTETAQRITTHERED